ncbi:MULTISPECIES: large conductance mechanosensitive channel protein MscL [Myroides]|uniref:Large-conductance mechanosensitive channel n=1 Tax=Myroides albus TaxID=2562892 RepID=A0A6I3LL54_9FLAO|nr:MULTISPECIES: large conductance mechanosensitive channel protein MscL [Myroides]MTG98457.1 large conductance mechanosensitive channel protein MscL [Myroides albus]MVX34430.1 large conductance mechanosensitive channel protein MscL [Myroides sp. LoEW2-1]UVD78214.1 large conductance mechanosensitive channel protein MscL [Myroides albus]
MGFLKEFKEFAVKGNVMDLAVGVIIGGAFGKIVTSVVNDVIMPVVSAIIGTPDFSNMYLVLKGEAADGAPLAAARGIDGNVVFAYGSFITEVINFTLLALCVFLMVKGINKLRKAEEAAVEEAPAVEEPKAPSQEDLLAEIRDLLKNQK